MAVNKVVLGDQTLIDLTADSVTPDKLFKGITAHNMKGESIVGTMEGGSTPSEPSDNTAVIFADYDGNLIDTWTKDEVASKTVLPTPPAHSGLVFEGWNWTLEDIKTDTTGQVITVGPFYHTESGLTEIDIHLDEATGKTVKFYHLLNYSGVSSVDWGDGNTNIENTHTYLNYGDYTIKIELSSEDALDLSYQQTSQDWAVKEIRYANNVNNIQAQYHRNLQRVALTETINYYQSWTFIEAPIVQLTLKNNVNVPQLITNGKSLKYVAVAKTSKFTYPSMNMDMSLYLEYVYVPVANAKGWFLGEKVKKYTIPDGITSIVDNAFNGCSSLQSINIPESVTSIGNNAFQNCSSLQSINIPSGVTSIGNNAFYGCSSLQSITIPSSVTSIGSYAFQNCSSLQSITIPSSVTSIETYAFQNCSSLYKAKINSSAKIDSFSYNFGRSYLTVFYDFSECSAVPVLSASNGIQEKDYVSAIIVPLSLYDEWKQATNWAAYASKIQPKGEGIVSFNGVNKLAYNEAATLIANYVSDTEPTNITVTASNPDALEIGQYTIDNTAKTIAIPVTAKSVTDTVTVTFSATFKDGVQSRTLSIKIKESFKTPSFTVTDVEGASYNFVLNDAGYYESTNKNVGDSAALCKLDITDLEDTSKVIFDCINSGEANYDYGMISKINTTLGTTNSEDSDSNLFVSFKGQSSTNVVTKSYPIDNVAACFFTLKFRKDGSGDQDNDSLQFKVRFE